MRERFRRGLLGATLLGLGSAEFSPPAQAAEPTHESAAATADPEEVRSQEETTEALRSVREAALASHFPDLALRIRPATGGLPGTEAWQLGIQQADTIELVATKYEIKDEADFLAWVQRALEKQGILKGEPTLEDRREELLAQTYPGIDLQLKRPMGISPEAEGWELYIVDNGVERRLGFKSPITDEAEFLAWVARVLQNSGIATGRTQ